MLDDEAHTTTRRGWRARLASSTRARRMRRPVLWGTMRRATPFDLPGGRGVAVWEHLVRDELRGLVPDRPGRGLVERDHRFGDLLSFESLDIIDTDPRNAACTRLADLGDVGTLPTAAYDTVLLTRACQLGRPFDVALENAWRSLVDGGVLLLAAKAVPDPEPPPYGEPPRAAHPGAGEIQQALARLHPPATHLEVVVRGGLTAAVAHLTGIAADELRAAELAGPGGQFGVAVVARAIKPSTVAGDR